MNVEAGDSQIPDHGIRGEVYFKKQYECAWQDKCYIIDVSDYYLSLTFHVLGCYTLKYPLKCALAGAASALR